MKTIEERAKKEFPSRAVKYKSDDIPYNERQSAIRMGYIKGATDQRSIDIEKACEWLKKELYDKDGFLTISSYWHLPIMIKAFKEYLNNE